MKQSKQTIFVTLLLAVVLALSACAAPPPQQATGGEAAPAAADASGGQVVLIIPEEPATLNQYLAVAAIVRQVADATTAGLSVVDQNGDFQPVLAEAIPSIADGTVSEDFLTVTWKLRPGLLWSDGTPITSDDVKFTWEAVSNPDSGAVLSNNFEKIASIDTPDELTAVVHYSEVNSAYPMQFAYGILPRHATGEANAMEKWEWNRNPVTAGAFVVSEWNSGDSIVMDRNPNYYLDGQPYLDRLIFKVVPDPGAQMAMMIQGEGQVHLWPGATKEDYDVQVEGEGALQEVPGQWNMALRFNLSQPFDDDTGPTPPHPILGDLKVRQALAYALDYDTIINDVNPGVSPATSPFAYGWYRCDIPRTYGFDVDKASGLLEEAGWVLGNDGIRVASGAANAEDGTRLSLQMEGYTNFQPLVKLEEAIVEMWKAVGVEATIQNDDFSIIFGSLADGSPRKTGNFDILVYDSSLSIDPQATIAGLFHSSAIPSADNPAGANYSRWVNADADAAIETAGSTVDVPTRQAAYCDLANLIDAELPQLHLYLFTEGYGATDALSGYAVSIWGSLTWDAQNWKLSQ
ncbi:MAG: peptide ABC transporter substrate-binding protein [Caldilineaceae bacterium]|nr:peptide ABC transporter substrate-binding protein [Caldilineaceae bacterium]